MSYRKGSMGAADEKEARIAKIVLTALTGIFFLCAYVFDTNLQDSVSRQGFVAHFFGVACYLAVPGVFYYGEKVFPKYDFTGFTYALSWIGLTAAGTLISAGFNFSL